MSSYSKYFEDIINYDEEDFIENPEKLKAIVDSFRDASSAMDEFLIFKGFEGDIHDAAEKKEYIENSFKKHGIDEPREVKEFYKNNKRLTVNKGIALCFAFGLSLDETNEFFRRVLLIRGLDLHTIEGLSYYFCIKNGFSYNEAVDLIAYAKNLSFDEKENSEIFYTSRIKAEVDELESLDELRDYFCKNIGQFKKNNRTALKNIYFLWDDLLKKDNGKNLFEIERELLRKTFNDEDDWRGVNIDSQKDSFPWQFYLQIFGYDLNKSSKIQKAYKKDRSLIELLKDNAYFRSEALELFPGRATFIAIKNDSRKISDESIRKWLILLSFYRFWVREIINTTGSEGYFEAVKDDNHRSMDDMNRFLTESGFPELYAGNPYDWIFMYSNMSPYPLDTFREIFGLIYENKEEEIERLCSENTD